MTEGHDNRLAIAKLEGELKALAERMETKPAEYRTDIPHLAEKMAERDKKAAQRETRLILSMAVMIGLAVAILGIFIRLPVPT